jgi:hypothetical protein
MAARTSFLSAFALGALTLITVGGCSRPADGTVDSLDSALSEQDFDATVRHLTALPYLPWAYTPDGCYARALYYSMLLTTKGVSTNHLYVVARPGTTLGGQWSWHVAPLVTKDGDPNHLYVLDPVYDTTKALTNLEWVAKQFHTNPALSSYPSLHVHPGTSYLAPYQPVHPLTTPAEPVASEYKEPIFGEMPSFKMLDVSNACNRMHQYIDREPGTTTAQRQEKHKALGLETQKLVRGLAEKSKLNGDAATLGASCTRGEVLEGGPELTPTTPVPALPEPTPTDEPLVEPNRL